MVKNDCKSDNLYQAVKLFWKKKDNGREGENIGQFSLIIFSLICSRGRPRFLTLRKPAAQASPDLRGAWASARRALLTQRNIRTDPRVRANPGVQQYICDKTAWPNLSLTYLTSLIFIHLLIHYTARAFNQAARFANGQASHLYQQ